MRTTDILLTAAIATGVAQAQCDTKTANAATKHDADIVTTAIEAGSCSTIIGAPKRSHAPQTRPNASAKMTSAIAAMTHPVRSRALFCSAGGSVSRSSMRGRSADFTMRSL